jgi:adenylosuccinate lyase
MRKFGRELLPDSLNFEEEKMRSMYESPLNSRYAGKEMSYLFSQEYKFKTWRKLWIALAETEKELGLNITDEQIAQMKEFKDDINYEAAEEREKIVRHDVMSHVYAFGTQAPLAMPIIHLGATSCFVGDNTDIIIMTEGMKLIKKQLVNVINELSKFAAEYKDMPTLGFTHFQPAQATTVGKRASLWLQDLIMDLEDLDYQISKAKLRGAKGTTGTQASFMELFDGDFEKVKRLDRLIAEKMGYESCFAVTGQTYPRKLDSQVLNVLSQIAQSAYKFSNDIRLLQHLKEIEEPFEKSQIGSSAMAYKRNPMRSERICSLAKYVIVDALNPAITASTQWFERTLDDSANKRLSIPEAFLCIDAILSLYRNIVEGLVVYPKVIEQRLSSELPFMATENIMMDAVKKGGNRQELHEKIREHSMAAGKVVKAEGKPNDLLQRIADDASFGLSLSELESIMDARNFVGRAPQQTEEFIAGRVKPILEANSSLIDENKDELRV